MKFLKHAKGGINDERIAIHCLESGCIGLYITSDLKNFLEISLVLDSREISRSLGMYIEQTNTSLLSPLSAVYVSINIAIKIKEPKIR